MPTLTINGTNYNDFLQAFAGNLTSPAAGQYYAVPPYGKPPTESTFQYQEQIITFPGVLDAAGSKRFSFGPRIISCDLIIVGTSKANAATAADSLMSSMNQVQRYAITLPNGVSRPGCKYLAAQEDDWIFSFANSFAVLLSCSFKQLQVS